MIILFMLSIFNIFEWACDEYHYAKDRYWETNIPEEKEYWKGYMDALGSLKNYIDPPMY